VVFAVFEPATLPEALGLLANEGDASAALAGGTDLLLRIRRGVRKYRSVVNIKFVPGLTGLTWDAQRGLTLGALTTFRTIEQNEHVRRHYLALVEAARVVAGVQLRNLVNGRVEATAVANEAEYHAFVGSRRKMAALREKLVANGVAPEAIDRVKAPAGLDLGAITPEEIAMSILAEITVERRRGQRGTNLVPAA